MTLTNWNIPEDKKNVRPLVLKEIEKNGLALCHASDELKKDAYIVNIAVKKRFCNIMGRLFF